MNKEIVENYKRYCARGDLYKRFGYNIAEERDFIIQKAWPLNGEILEIGTGKGYFTVALAQKGYQFTTVDISEEEQRFAQINIRYLGLEERVSFIVENAENLNFEEERFDIVFSINLIHHLTNPFKVADELIRVVLFTGKIVLSDFSKEGLELVDKVHMSEGRRHPVGRYNLNDVENYLAEKNFKMEKHRNTFQEILIIYKWNN